MIGERIRKIRKQRGISLTKLAQLSGVSKSYLSYLERDLKKNPSIIIVKKVASILEIPLETLLSNDLGNIIQVDEEWLKLVNSAISSGVTKENFRQFLEYWIQLSISDTT